MEREKTELYEKKLDRTLGWISNSDSKIGYVLAFNGVMIGLMINRVPEIIKLMGKGFSISSLTFGFFSIAYLLIFSVSLYYGFKVVFPDIEERKESYFFFGSIAKMDKKKFKEGIKSMENEEIENQLLDQIYINSTIAKQKFENIQKSLKALLIGFICWAILLFLIEVGGICSN